MKLLAIDTAFSACSVAVFADGGVVAERSEAMERGHAEALMPMVAALLQAAAAACPRGFRDLDGIAVTVGPGAFTGIRIGLAAARAMAAAAGLPVVGFTTLETVAAAQPAAARPLLVALESKRTDVYAQLFRAGATPLDHPRAILPEAIAPLLPDGPVALAGNAAGAVAAALRAAGRKVRALPGPGDPAAGTLARLGAARLAVGRPEGPPRPLYLRAPDVTLPAGRG